MRNAAALRHGCHGLNGCHGLSILHRPDFIAIFCSAPRPCLRTPATAGRPRKRQRASRDHPHTSVWAARLVGVMISMDPKRRGPRRRPARDHGGRAPLHPASLTISVCRFVIHTRGAGNARITYTAAGHGGAVRTCEDGEHRAGSSPGVRAALAPSPPARRDVHVELVLAGTGSWSPQRMTSSADWTGLPSIASVP